MLSVTGLATRQFRGQYTQLAPVPGTVCAIGAEQFKSGVAGTAVPYVISADLSLACVVVLRKMRQPLFCVSPVEFGSLSSERDILRAIPQYRFITQFARKRTLRVGTTNLL